MKLNLLIGMVAVATSASVYHFLDTHTAFLAFGLTISTMPKAAEALPFPLASMASLFARDDTTDASDATHVAANDAAQNATHHHHLHHNGTAGAVSNGTRPHHHNERADTTSAYDGDDGNDADTLSLLSRDESFQNETKSSATDTNSTSSSTSTITVQSGETFISISHAQGIALAALEAANPGVNPGSLQPGQVLNLPGASVVSSNNNGTKNGTVAGFKRELVHLAEMLDGPVRLWARGVTVHLWAGGERRIRG